jgi:type VI secretion system secreted protein VgrG
MSGVLDILTITTPLPDTSFVVTGLEGREQISRPFSYSVELGAGSAKLDAADLIDQQVVVTLGDPAVDGRHFNGIVQAVAQLPETDGKLWRYRLTVVPRLWFLGQTKCCRFFQNLSVPDIAQKILNDFGVTFTNALQASYATRDYTVMFNESYLHFLQRIFEDEGIFYFFTHTADEHTMVLGDYKTAFGEITSYSVTLRHAQGDEDLSSWEQEDEAALGQVIVDDYDPAVNSLAPAALRGQVASTSKDTGAGTRVHYHWPAVRTTADDAKTRATWRIEAAEAAAQSFAGAGGAMDFFAGGKFTLINDPTNGGASSDYVLRAVSYHVTDHGGGAGGPVVAMHCTAFLAATQWREVPEFAAPVMAGLYSAKVIGPDGEEIYIDDLGRIKVWFPWDFNSDITSDATLWVRVMQPWGGAGWGHQFIPRIGMEVVVAFLEGDVNRPCVVGSFYNSDNAPLFSPSNKNKSGIRTMSTPKGSAATYSEMSFDDTKGSEVFLLHAEKDHHVEVENDQILTVGGKRTDTVTGDQTVKVTQGNHAETIDQGNHSTTVSTGNHATTVSTGNHSTTVSQGNRSAAISLGNDTVKVDLGAISHEAMQSITLKVGQNSIVIDQTGITMKGIMIQATGQAMATVKGAMVEVNGSGMLTLAGGVTMIN